jgi:hypothetical protein
MRAILHLDPSIRTAGAIGARCRGASGGLLFAVPELTRSDDIKLNERVLLPRNPHRIS